jgi:hypothetical protein
MEMTMAIDTTDQAITNEIADAKQALLALASEDQRDGWTARELLTRARNGWSSAVMGLALRSLLDDGRLEQGEDLRIRVRT